MTTQHRPAVRRRLAALAVVAGLAVSACGGDSDDDTATDDAPAQDDSSDDGADDESADDSGDDGADEPADAIEQSGEDREEAIDVTIAESENTDPVMGGTLRYGLEADGNGLNPTASSLSAPGLTMANAVFDTLTAIDADSTAVPCSRRVGHAERRLHPVDAHPAPRHHVPRRHAARRGGGRGQLRGPARPPARRAGRQAFYPESGAVEAVDELTVVYTLLEPNAGFPSSLSTQLGFVASPTWLQEASLADGTLNQAPVGTGPFMFESRSEAGDPLRETPTGGTASRTSTPSVPASEPIPTPRRALFGGELGALPRRTRRRSSTSPKTTRCRTCSTARARSRCDDQLERAAVRRHPCPPGADTRHAGRPLQRADRARRQPSGRPRCSPRQPVLQPRRRPGTRRRPSHLSTRCRVLRRARRRREHTVLGTTVHRQADQHRTAVVGSVGRPDPHRRPAQRAVDRAGFSVTFDELLQDEHISQTAFGQYNVNTWRQFGAENPSDDRVWLMCRNIGGISLNWPRFCDEERDAILLEIAATPDPADQVELLAATSEKISRTTCTSSSTTPCGTTPSPTTSTGSATTRHPATTRSR
ncbi:MAG: ABC transporter substrate-binding protein [Ilumatobacteraceae bacterium]